LTELSVCNCEPTPTLWIAPELIDPSAEKNRFQAKEEMRFSDQSQARFSITFLQPLVKQGEKIEQTTKVNNNTAPEKTVEKPEGKEQLRTRNSKPSLN